MGLFKKLGVSGKVSPSIDWELTPADTFGTFESWGGRERVRSSTERFYYFYIDGWEKPAALCLMERGIKFARVLARIDAPQELIDKCVAGQGKVSTLERSYAIDDALEKWLRQNVVNTDDDSRVIPVDSGLGEESLETGLPGKDAPLPEIDMIRLRSEPATIKEEEVPAIVRARNFFDSRNNPKGSFDNYLVDNGDASTVTDMATGIMWQRGGCDITSIRHVQKYVADLNSRRFAGCDGWRLPTMEEALSLLEPVLNDKGLYLAPCFSREQPFIFLADNRDPGGYWFADFKQGAVFWASGTIPGGFGRVCRSL